MYQNQMECQYPLNAVRIIKHVKQNKVTVNCLSHALVLNECLLSLGFISRVIFCLPIDINPVENHVLLHVYSEKNNKWIAIDPSWNCFFCDTQDKMLSLPEIRNAIIEDIPFSIKYNHRKFAGVAVSNYKKYFSWDNLYSYLCKNMFRFSYISYSDFNMIIQYELMPSTMLGKEIEIVECHDFVIVKRFLTNEFDFWSLIKEK